MLTASRPFGVRTVAIAFAALVLCAPLAAQAADSDPPVITHTVPQQVPRGKVKVEFSIFDQSALFGVLFHWRHVGDASYRQIDFPTSQAKYFAEFEASKDFEFWIEAYDEHGNGPALDGTAEAPIGVRVVEPGLTTENIHATPPGNDPAFGLGDEPSQGPATPDLPLRTTRVSRVQVARALQPKMWEARVNAGFQYGGDFILPNTSVSGQSAALQLSYGVLDFLQASLATGFRRSSAGNLAPLSSVNDLTLAAKVVSGPLGAARLGGELSLEFPTAVDRDFLAGAGCTTASGAECAAPGFVVSPTLSGFASLALPQARLHANIAYKWDNSENLLPGQWPAFATYALGLSRYDFLSVGLAAEIPINQVVPYLEWTIDVPVNRRRFGSCTAEGETKTCGPSTGLFPAQGYQVPQRLGLGARYEISAVMGVDLSVELSLTQAGRGLGSTDKTVKPLALDGVAPPPPVAGRLNFVWQFGTTPVDDTVPTDFGTDPEHSTEPSPL